MHIDLSTVIGIVVGVASVAAVQWKILMALYVVPRDYELEVLKRRVDELSREQIRKEETRRQPFSPSEEASVTKIQHVPTAPLEIGDADAVKLGIDPYKSLEAYYQMTHNPQLTEFQRRAIAETTLGLEVLWKAQVRSITETNEGKYVVFVAPNLSSAADAYCLFDKSHYSGLAKLKRGDEVCIRGLIDNVRGVVTIVDCSFQYEYADG